VSDYVVEVRAHGDQFTPVGIGPADMATPTQTHEELCRHAVGRAGGLGLGAIDRVLVDAGASIDPVEWLLAPLAGQASIVLCRNLDRAKLTDRAAAERVTVDLTGR
jgi:hypothetical protein